MPTYARLAMFGSRYATSNDDVMVISRRPPVVSKPGHGHRPWIAAKQKRAEGRNRNKRMKHLLHLETIGQGDSPVAIAIRRKLGMN